METGNKNSGEQKASFFSSPLLWSAWILLFVILFFGVSIDIRPPGSARAATPVKGQGTPRFLSKWVSSVPVPDLTATLDPIPSLIAGDVHTFSGAISNIGTKTADTSTARFLLDSNPPDFQSVSAIPQGKSRAVSSSPWTAVAGTHTIQLCAEIVPEEVTTTNNCAPPQTFTVVSTPAPAADIRADGSSGPITISSESAAVITWCGASAAPCANATGCSVLPSGWTGISGTQSTGPLTSTQVYTLTCSGPGGTASDSVTVNIAGATSKPPPTFREVNP